MLQKCGDDNELREWVEYQVIHTICFKKQPNVPTDESNDDTYACAYVIHNISELAGVGPAFKRMFKAYVFVKCSLCEFEPNPEIARPADSTWGHYLKNVQGQGSLCTIPRIYAAYLRGFDRGKDSGGQAWRWLARFLKTPPPAKTEGASPAVLQEFLKVTAGTLHRQYGQFFLKLLEFIINTWLPTEELKSEVDEFKARQTQLRKRIQTWLNPKCPDDQFDDEAAFKELLS